MNFLAGITDEEEKMSKHREIGKTKELNDNKKNLLNTWFTTVAGNECHNKKDEKTGEYFYLSYNDFSDTYEINIPEETAFGKRLSNDIFVLSGDFRNEYEKCKTYEECMRIYNDNKDKQL